MKFSTAILAAAAIAASVHSRPVRRDVNAALVPEFGISPGVNPTGTGCVHLNRSRVDPGTMCSQRDDLL